MIRTKPIPVILQGDPVQAIHAYAQAYRAYFERHDDGRLTCLDLAPRWGVWPGYGTLSCDRSVKAAQILTDIVAHTRRAIQIGKPWGAGWPCPRPICLRWSIGSWSRPN
nr:hypothetical protein [Halomicronema hongdechloris]